MSESYIVKPVINESSVDKVLTEAKADNKVSVLKPRIEAIHAGRTRNNNIYPAEKLRGDRTFKDANGNIMPTGVHSFTQPYPKPMVIDHNPTADNCTGRITNAQFVKDAVTGKEMIVIIPEITSEDAIQKVKDGRYMTVSVGSETDSAICNICGKDIINEGWCEHDKGQSYDGVVCGWIVGNIWFDECSWVAVPADTTAMVTDPGEAITMEAYMEVNGEHFNLSNESGVSKLSESAANTLGLVDSKKQPEGGLQTMPKINNDPTEVKEDVVDKPTTNPDVGVLSEDAKDAPEIEPDAKDAIIAERDATIVSKDAEIETLKTEKAELEAQIASLNKEKEDLEADKQALITQCTEVKASAFQDLVEKVVDLKIGLGKPGTENREESVNEHMTRSEQSLKDSYTDLMAEFKTTKKQFVPSKVTAPGASAIDGEPNSVIEGLTTDKEPSAPVVLTAEQILKNLLRGDYRK